MACLIRLQMKSVNLRGNPNYWSEEEQFLQFLRFSTIQPSFYGLTIFTVLSNNIANTFFADTQQIVHFKGT